VDRKPNIAERLDEALFDEHSPHLDRFGLLLLTIVASLVVLSLVDIAPGGENVKAGIGGMVIAFSVSAMLVLAVRASGVRRSWRRGADVIAAVAIVASAVVLTGDLAGWRGIDPENATPLPSPLWVVLSLFLPVIVVRRILRHRRVAVSTLLGAVCAYLLIAFTFTFVFLTVNALEPGYFFGRAEPTTSFTYFSLASITTLGTGSDLQASSNLGQLLSVTETILGQIFLVTLVAALVGLYAANRRQEA
jgi:hypothetical protein